MLMRLYRWTVVALILANLAVGSLIFFAPQLFGQLSGFAVGDLAVMRGYGQKIVLMAIVYTVLVTNLQRAGILLWLPFLDELWNAATDLYELRAGHPEPELLVQMAVFHALMAFLLLLSTPAAARAAKRTRGLARGV
jgi:hypothetical protein